MAPHQTSKVCLAVILAAVGLSVRLSTTRGASYALEGSYSCRRPQHVASADLSHMEHSILHDRHAKIAAVGSSSTYGFGASVPTMSYPAQLQAMLRAGLPSIEFIVENEGQSGELAQAAAGRINADILSRSPDLVIWQVGSAEALKNVAVEAFAGTLSSELQTIRARKTDVVLIDMQWSAALQQSAHYVALNAAIHRVAAIEHVALVEGYDLMRAAALLSGQEKMLSPDGFHMNDDGYACLAETIAATIMTRLREDRVVGPAHSL